MHQTRKHLAFAAMAVLLSVAGAATARADLQGRYLTQDTSKGFDAYYDTTLNVTWLADALYGGRMDWDTADAWIQTLTLGGYNDWRLPTYSNGSGDGTTGEFYRMWVVELGNNADQQHPTSNYNPGPFHNVEYYMNSGAYNPTAAYWTSYSYSDFAMAWMTFNAGYIGQYRQWTYYGVWLCRTGDSGWAPARCPADYNGDGFVDGLDYDLFNIDFESFDPAQQIHADFNHDGFVDGMDYDGFMAAFETPC